RDFDEQEHRAPSLARELRVLAGCIWHTVRRRCANGPVMAAHTWGRIARALDGRRDTLRGDPRDDFLAGESGTVGGRRDALRTLSDRVLDLRATIRRGPVRFAARGLRRRVPLLGG